MSKRQYPEYKQLDLPAIAAEVRSFWESGQVFERTLSEREGRPAFVFYEGPPSANGLPGIHHVMGRTIKDIFCRYQTLRGKRVNRKAGWDTHGLPIELAVEKTLGITKEDIGSKISVEDYNRACRSEVMKYTDRWEELTRVMGYWVDMKDPYITYDNKYIESVWWLLGRLFEKDLLYKGFTIQPYSPAAGTGLSSHELNQPGCYREVKDTTAVAMFQVTGAQHITPGEPICLLAWTTTPWTLPSNTALAVGSDIDYDVLQTFNPYTHAPVNVVLAHERRAAWFPDKNAELDPDAYKPGDKNIPFRWLKTVKGAQLEGLTYQQLLPFAQPEDGDAFRVLIGDFVTTEEGTGIVHLAPSFGADDFRVARQNGIGSLTLVDRRGRFLPSVSDGIFLFGEEYVKEAYYSETEKTAECERQKKALSGFMQDTSKLTYLNVDERICLKLQSEGKLFRKEKYSHNYPHCWRTDKPILYYPLDAWFIRIPQIRERMVALNKTINWRPEATGTGRFGNWLENANDWNLSRSRFWGIPLPIWRTPDGTESRCINSLATLREELDKSVAAGFMQQNPLAAFIPGDNSAENYQVFDLHKPYVDTLVLVSPSGQKMFREADLIDVWFDSGAMPYAQVHYPFENKEVIDDRKGFPADYIAEGVDQTRGWFYTLHAIAAMCFDSVAYKNVISNGLVLDKNGNKMSKRLGNAIDPFATIARYGPDATRWYMITNAQPWDNLKFDLAGIEEVQRKFFGTLYNTYQFFATYANIDQWVPPRPGDANEPGSELDQWIASRLQSLVARVTESLDDYNPTPAARAIESFVSDHLSNWYVRLSRRRFWQGQLDSDKHRAYETLYDCLLTVARLMSPFAPFFAEWLYGNLTAQLPPEVRTALGVHDSVHLDLLNPADVRRIDPELEGRMGLAQDVTSLILSIRKKEGIRVRQPLQTIRIPVLHEPDRARIEAVRELILAETNVRFLECVTEGEAEIVKNLKLNFKTLGARCGKHMKSVQAYAAQHAQEIIRSVERSGAAEVPAGDEVITLNREDVEIVPVDMPGWKVVNDGALTVALDITITDDLRSEGLAREFVNRVQNLRKDSGLEVTDRIRVLVRTNPHLDSALQLNSEYIRAQILAGELTLVESLENGQPVEIDEGIVTDIFIQKLK